MSKDPKSTPKKLTADKLKPRTKEEWEKYWVSGPGDIEILDFTPTGRPFRDDWESKDNTLLS